MMQAGADLWQTAGFLGMTVEMLERVYGHQHPDYQADVADVLAGQNRDRYPVNKTRLTQPNATKNARFTRGTE